jgi:hypothetical protein
MDKFLAIVLLIIVILIAIPHIKAGEWFAPTAVMPNSWITTSQLDDDSLAQANAVPSTGSGMFHFDFWNHSPYDARPIQKSDFDIRL